MPEARIQGGGEGDRSPMWPRGMGRARAFSSVAAFGVSVIGRPSQLGAARPRRSPRRAGAEQRRSQAVGAKSAPPTDVSEQETAAGPLLIPSCERIACLLVHDLCQPLTAIAMHAALAQRTLERWDQKGDLAECAAAIAAQAGRALDTAHQILAFAARGDTDRSRHDVSQLVRRILKDFRQRPQAGHIKIRLHAPPRCDAVIDGFLIERAVRNLLENAIAALLRNTDTHGLRIDVSVRNEHGRALSIAVADNGPGLPAGSAELFEPGTSQSPSGNGLGLTLCRAIAQAHGGLVGIEPRGRGGTVAWITFPLDH